MFRSDRLFTNDTGNYAGSIQSSGVSAASDDESSQVSILLRPSAKSIYLQRKAYAVSMNELMNKFQYRVEHLFTCDLDGRELRSVADCVERLNLLDGMGKVWAQNMMLEVRGVHLLLTDTNTKEELDSIAISDILELKAVPNPGLFNSLLTVSVQSRRKETTTVFMFQCEDIEAEYVQKDLSKLLSRRREDPHVHCSAGVHAAKPSERKEQSPRGHSVSPGYEEDDILEPELVVLQMEEEEEEEVSPSREGIQLPCRDRERDTSVDILHQVLGDIQVFMGQVAAVAAKNAKKRVKKKKGKVMDGMPPKEEFAECLHKIKCGFNLLGDLNGKINNPSAPEHVHSLFSILAFIISHCPENLPPTIVTPLLTPQCIRLLRDEASTQEQQLWESLGDAWNMPSTQRPEKDFSTYTPKFSDGWKPPETTHSLMSVNWTPQHHPQKTRSGESTPRQMRVTCDFSSRNRKELTVRKGEIVELLDTSKQWWKVRNSRGEEGFVPSNVFEDYEKQPNRENEGPPVLTKKSKPSEVKAWLEDKGFSKITVRCLGGLSGSVLLAMTREELKVVCPEEGGRVFVQLQAVKAGITAAD